MVTTLRPGQTLSSSTGAVLSDPGHVRIDAKTISENYVRDRTQLHDNAHITEGLYIFELRVNGDLKALVPLVLNPESESLTEQFAVSTTAGAGGALFAEENGIVMRRYTLRGTTGLKLKISPLQQLVFTDDLVKAGTRSYARGQSVSAIDSHAALSGPAHLQILQDRIFRDYADLKRNPSTAAGVVMFLHVTREREVWRVLPETFSIPRDVARRTFASYEISLIITGKGTYDDKLTQVWKGAEWDPRKHLPQLSNEQRPAPPYDRPRGYTPHTEPAESSKHALKGLQGILNELAPKDSMWSDILRTVDKVRKGIGKLVTKIKQLLALVTDFINGVISVVKLIIDLARAVIATVNNFIEAIESIFEATMSLVSAPLSLLREARNFANGLVLTFKENSQQWANTLDRWGHAQWNPLAPENQANLSPTLRVSANKGSLATSSQRDVSPSNALNTPRSVKPTKVKTGDDIQMIAQRELGDVTRWVELVVLNNLSPPFISESRLPSTLRPGDDILVPTNEMPESGDRIIAVGVDANADIFEQAFGRDLQFVEVANNVFDWTINENLDDFISVAGIDNLGQALRRRILERRGQNPFFPDLGSDESIGFTNDAASVEIRRINFTRAIEADPRVLYVPRLDLSSPSGDTLVADLDVIVYGLARREGFILPA